MQDEREQIARIIDPTAFQTHLNKNGIEVGWDIDEGSRRRAFITADQILTLRQPPAPQFVADMFWKEEPDGEGSASSPEDVIADLMDWSGSRGPDVFKLQQAMSGPPFWCVGVCDAAGEVTVTEYPSEAEAKAAIPTPPEPDQ